MRGEGLGGDFGVKSDTFLAYWVLFTWGLNFGMFFCCAFGMGLVCVL